MSRVKKIELKDEKELEMIIYKNSTYLEEGLKIIERQFPSESGPIDLLAVDTDNNLVVIELKIKESDDILIQALRYYDYCIQNYDRIKNMYPEKIDELSGEIRIILLAPSFSYGLQKAAKYIEPQLDLIEYDYIEVEKQKVLYCKNRVIEPTKPIPQRKTVDDHLNYILNDNVRDLCRQTIDEIKEIDPEEIEIRSAKYYIGFQFRGRLFARIKTRHEYFHLMGVQSGDWSVESTKIKHKKDFTKNILNKIESLYSELK